MIEKIEVKLFFEKEDAERFELWLAMHRKTKSSFAKECAMSRVNLYNILDGKQPVNDAFKDHYDLLNKSFTIR